MIDLDPPVDDPFIRQELVETAYHVLWELVHVFLEHSERTVHDTGAASFLYPFLGERETDEEAVLEDVRRSILMKAEEIGALREQTLTEGARDAARRGGGDARRRARARARQRRLGHRRDGPRRRPRARRPAGDRPHRRPGDPHRDRQRRRRRGDLRAPGDRVRARRRRAGRALHQRRLGERDLGAGRGAPPRAGDDRVRRLRRRPDRRRAARRPRRGHALAAHPAHPGGAGERLPRPLRADRDASTQRSAASSARWP